MAFVWNGEKQDNYDIYVKLVDASGPPLRLTTDPASDTLPGLVARRAPDRVPAHAPSRTTPPTYRPPGARGGTVMVMPALGGPERKVADVPGARCPTLSWTPDGRWLATPDRGPSGGQRGLPPSRGAGGDEAAHVEPRERPTSARPCLPTGACSPTPRARARVRADAIQVLELQPDSGRQGRPGAVTRRAAVGAAFGIAWAADGAEISCGVRRDYLYGASRSRGAGERADRAGRTAGPHPAASRARDRLVFTRGIHERDVWKLERGPPGPPRSSPRRALDQSPQFSPDGTRIAYCSDRGSESRGVFVAKRTARTPFQLTDGLGREQCSPRWSPDGRRIAFDSKREDRDWTSS